jgi:exonuclease-1
MGIPGLLPALKSITSTKHIGEYKGLTAGIDASGWLYKGLYTCSLEVVKDGPDASDKYIDYCLRRVELLLTHEVTPILIFDGGPLPTKASKEQERRTSRLENRTKGLEALRSGIGGNDLARQYLSKALQVTPAMTQRLMQALKERKVHFIVAPYEADAQLAFMSQNKMVDFCISEDSDLLAYRVQTVFYKMDPEGNGEEIRLRNLGATEALDLLCWSHDQFVDMCILAGCDYCARLTGLGLKRAHKLIKRHRSAEKLFKVWTLSCGVWALSCGDASILDR